MLSISGVMPIHNEALMLRYSLPSLSKAKINELVFILDRCTDESLKIINNWVEKAKPEFTIKIKQKNKQLWTNAIAEAFNMGFEHATSEIIYSLASDCVYDSRIFLFNLKYDAISYSYVNRDKRINQIRQNYEVFLQKMTRFKQVGGVYGVKKRVWQKVGGFSLSSSSKINLSHPHGHNFFNKLKEQGFKLGYEKSGTVHLRDNSLTKEGQIRRGKYRKAVNESIFKVLKHSFIHFSPYVLKGFLS